MRLGKAKVHLKALTPARYSYPNGPHWGRGHGHFSKTLVLTSSEVMKMAEANVAVRQGRKTLF